MLVQCMLICIVTIKAHPLSRLLPLLAPLNSHVHPVSWPQTSAIGVGCYETSIAMVTHSSHAPDSGGSSVPGGEGVELIYNVAVMLVM